MPSQNGAVQNCIGRIFLLPTLNASGSSMKYAPRESYFRGFLIAAWAAGDGTGKSRLILSQTLALLCIS